MQRMRLILLQSGTKRDGTPWYHAHLFGKKVDGTPGLLDVWLSPEVGGKLMRMGAISQVDVMVRFGLNERFKPDIVDVDVDVELPDGETFDLGGGNPV